MGKEYKIEALLPGWFEGSLIPSEQEKVQQWINESSQNKQRFNEFEMLWKQTEQLKVMQKYNAQKALEKVHNKIEAKKRLGALEVFKRLAAVLVVPLLLASLYFYLENTSETESQIQWYTLETGPGMRSRFQLPDGSNVYLNSNTTLRYPLTFSGTSRNVELNGEAYFDVAKNDRKPFLVNTGKITIEVTGTEFKASNYTEEKLTEIVLVEGSVNLCQCNPEGGRNVIQALRPGEMATIEESDNKLFVENVDVEKYIAWKDGKLMFREDSMEEVVRRLNRWYNVDIQLSDRIEDYVYNATFEDESLFQVLDLLKLSAPIDYVIKKRQRITDDTFSKMEIEIIQK